MLGDKKVEYSKWSDTAINCPHCGEMNLHQIKTEVFDRDTEDAPIGRHVFLDKRIHIDQNMANNPSGRRDGLRIYFFCEHCSEGDFEQVACVLNIYQHKGSTFMEWDP
jgi:transcription elongation factor Elf1